MKIALPIAGDQLCMHFGHCERFDFFDVNPETKEILKKESFTPPPHEPGLYPRLLGEKGAKIIIAGGMGPRAQELFNQNGVNVVIGANSASGSPEDIVRLFLAGNLETGDNACDH
ncbi:NifB/NifX family molybdenum-iron cluster-binding protein [Pelotomaculum sp. PtaB.Bin117]|nr:NifB/NifX family molybdenum-iron cluster-binding protein [Pelotomaculum sp. PtaB.Bin117]OPX86921.1 MAG: Dinitrogenase iron-molybdenum cofactor [Pelotomaculum sp. PtaB.Bin117]